MHPSSSSTTSANRDKVNVAHAPLTAHAGLLVAISRTGWFGRMSGCGMVSTDHCHGILRNMVLQLKLAIFTLSTRKRLRTKSVRHRQTGFGHPIDQILLPFSNRRTYSVFCETTAVPSQMCHLNTDLLSESTALRLSSSRTEGPNLLPNCLPRRHRARYLYASPPMSFCAT